MNNAQTRATADSHYGSTDERFAFLSRGYSDAWAGMRHAFFNNDDVFVMTAPEGAGKTTLLANFLCEFASEEVFVAALSATELKDVSLFDHTLSLLGIDDEAPDRFSALEQIVKRLSNYSHAVLAIDDAHALTDSALRDLLVLSYLRRARGPMLQVILAGEESLMAALKSCELVQMNLWRVESQQLSPLSVQETGKFIQGWFAHREGAHSPVFTAEAIGLVHRWSQGVPGRLIRFCHWFAHHGDDDLEGRDEFGREEVRKGIRGQRRLAGIGARRELATHYGGAVESLQPTEPADDGPEAADDILPSLEGSGEARTDDGTDGANYFRRVDAPPAPTETAGDASSSLEPLPPGGANTIDQPPAGEAVPYAGNTSRETFVDRFLPFRRWLQDKPEKARDQCLAVIALVCLGMIGPFLLGYLSGPAATPTDGRSAPAPAAAETPVVTDPVSRVPFPPLPVTSVSFGVDARSPQSSPAAEEVTDVAMKSANELAVAEPELPSAGVQSAEQPTAGESPAVRDSVQAAEIENLLRLGGAALEKDYLRTPPEQSAWHYYRQVLELDPGNVAATLGMKLIVARYAELTRRVIERGDLASAQVFINRGLGVVPGDATLVALQGEVDAALPAQSAAERARLQALRDSEQQREGDGSLNPLQWLGKLLGGDAKQGEPRE